MYARSLKSIGRTSASMQSGLIGDDFANAGLIVEWQDRYANVFNEDVICGYWIVILETPQAFSPFAKTTSTASVVASEQTTFQGFQHSPRFTALALHRSFLTARGSRYRSRGHRLLHRST